MWLPCPETIALIGHYQVTWSLHRSAIGENMVLNWALLHNNDMTRDEHMIFVIFFQIIEKTNLYLLENVPILDMCCIVIIFANNPIKGRVWQRNIGKVKKFGLFRINIFRINCHFLVGGWKTPPSTGVRLKDLSQKSYSCHWLWSMHGARMGVILTLLHIAISHDIKFHQQHHHHCLEATTTMVLPSTWQWTAFNDRCYQGSSLK